MPCEKAEDLFTVWSWTEDIEGISRCFFPFFKEPVWTIFRILFHVCVFPESLFKNAINIRVLCI
jgi:hypothetical protein